MAKSIFEKTMQACLESKRINENRKAPKKITESVKAKKLVEDEDIMDIDINEEEEEEPEERMDDIEDNIVVVVDPEVSEDEIMDVASDAQEIIDNTPEGEIPCTDEFIGDMTYTCPICGNTFFSETEMGEGDECPVCGDTPSNFLLVGEVAESDGVAGEEAEAEKEIEEPAEEEEPIEEPEEELELIDVDFEEEKEEECKDPLMIDESTFNPFMTKFIRENYKNADTFTVVGAKRIGKKFTMECLIKFKSGKTKSVVLTTENFEKKSQDIAFYDNGIFKAESKSNAKVAPFIFTTSIKDNVIKCEGFKYSFLTKTTEGKKLRVYGKLVEAKKANFQKGRRA